MTHNSKPGRSGRLWWAVRTYIAALFVGSAASFILFVAQGQAAPVHPFLSELSLNGSSKAAAPKEFDKACGAAVDSQGDVYVASAGLSAIDAFDAEHHYLTTIADPNEPCGLAVDKAGNLYASDAATGKVVRYTPDAYPFSGTPAYAAPITIDASGSAKGIAVDPTDNSLYVAEGNRVAYYIDEVQAIEVTGTSGTYKLSFGGQETAPIPYSASHAEVQSALSALSAIGAGSVSVSGDGTEHVVTFEGALAHADVETLGANTSGLSGGGVEVNETVKGASGHFGEGDLTNAFGVASYTSNPTSAAFFQRRYISVADVATDEIQVFVGGMDSPDRFLPETLELRKTIDGSQVPGGSLGLAGTGAYLGVDPISGHLYSFDSQHSVVDEFEASGHYFTQIAHSFADAKPSAIAVMPQWNESQRVTIDATGGNFKLAFEGEETAGLKFNATALEVQKALEGLTSIGGGNVAVSGGPSPEGYLITFVGALGKRNVSQLASVAAGLTGDAPGVPGTGPDASVEVVKQGYGPGMVYVTSGAGAGAEVLAFGAVPDSTRLPLPEPRSKKGEQVCGTVVDDHGNVYVADKTGISVYSPSDQKLASIPNFDTPCALAVDSGGNLYAVESGVVGHRVALYKPQAYPPTAGTTYSGPFVIEVTEAVGTSRGIAVNPANDHLFVTHLSNPIVEYSAAQSGSEVLNSNFGDIGSASGIDVYGANGDVYIEASGICGGICVLNAAGTSILARIDGSDSPRGTFSGMEDSVAVDQSDGHALVGGMYDRGAVEEFEPSGAFVGEFGSGSFPSVSGRDDIAVDNSGGPNDGDVYAAHFKLLSAFGPLSYGEPPNVVTGSASQVGGGEATLNGSVDPRGVGLEECRFDYTTEADFQANGFGGVEDKQAECVPGAGEIGQVSKPVAVHARITGLDPAERYRFRLFAKSRYGPGPGEEGEAGLFGPPVLTTKAAKPVLYREATLRANVDPSGLATKYRFEYLTHTQYLEGGETFAGAQATPWQVLSASAGPTDVEGFPIGLAEGTAYDFRIVVENEGAIVEGEDQTFVTLARHPVLNCPNSTLRLENSSSSLPDCRAYELVTPADTHGNSPFAEFAGFNNWLVTPSGSTAGESLAFFTEGTLPGTEGSGLRDAFRATRSAAGWGSSLFGPTSVQKGDFSGDSSSGISSDQLYSFWFFGAATPPGALPFGHYLRTPPGSPQPSPHCAVEAEPEGRFEAIGCGSLGTDLEAEGRFVAPGGTHVIFSTETTSAHTSVQLEPNAPPSPRGAVYDRRPGGPTHVVSLLPEDATPGSDASYLGANEDGSAVVFSVGGKLYVRLDDAETVEVAPAGAFSGLSASGERVFYANAGAIYAFDTAGESTTQIAPAAKFVQVSADGSHVYFLSEEDLAEGGVQGSPNLYLWDGAGTAFVATLDARDLRQSGQQLFPGTAQSDAVALDSWTATCARSGEGIGRAYCPSRTTPDGEFSVFQSHADLVPPYEGDGHSEIYRYDAADKSLLCVSCDPSGAPAVADADLQPFEPPQSAPARATTVVPGVTEGGKEVFFQTTASLLPEDANTVLDVYEWQAPGVGGCARADGCLSLISSGQGSNPSYIYSMTPDGHDVFFSTQERLIGSDISGSPSIYDARVEGGFPQPHEAEPCHGDACQAQGVIQPSRPAITTQVPSPGNAALSRPCRKGTHRVRKAGKVRCVSRHRGHRHRHRRGGRR